MLSFPMPLSPNTITLVLVEMTLLPSPYYPQQSAHIRGLTSKLDIKRQQELEALKISTLFICYKIEKLIEYYLVITLIYSMNKWEEYCEVFVVL